MRYVITGASGLLGTTLTQALREDGHEVASLSRRPDPNDQASFAWNPDRGEIDRKAFDQCDVVVHLAGESVSKRWTKARMRTILESRVKGTTLIAETIAKLEKKPRALLSASAVGIYGNRGDLVLTESSEFGDNFLANVCRDWEKATQPASDAGVRIVNLRIGVVLTAQGGALKKLLPAFKLGLGGRIGDGRAWMAWISLADTIGVIRFASENNQIVGPINVTAPEPVTNAEFTRSVARAVKRPAFLPVPEFALKLALGKMAEGMLLTSTRAVPAKLQEQGYTFTHTRLDDALKSIFG